MSKPHLVVLTGAGISAESGLRTFRDTDGLWEGYAIEEVATPRAWRRNPKLVLDFYNMRRRDVRAAEPNAAHKALAALEAQYDVTVITQNIDDLHERAGSTRIIHLHGEIFKMRSDRDETLVEAIHDDMPEGALAPDGGWWRPHIVWFEEPVPMIGRAAQVTASADIFLVVGTSLQVYPAAGLINMAPAGVPVLVVDKKIPPVAPSPHLVLIEQPATLGMQEVLARLLNRP
ncbi:SIR2 family NAD-dependent protein deacylase [Dinghuibacter silviterrae]|uniref:NAD-dependent protein deacylase n=1 Tax=Dinghuibacter silviterrae TaxID=1539049 RepID=A0A4R8DWC5_9BACT|nr:NAD-dependent deacylase [Dinghuibacter silviterrae]TDX01717.1 NAD-dependent deacetylase [Dinghuibacter silviterrae]